MGTEFACALGAMLCYGLADLVYKRAAMAGVKPHHFLMVQAWMFAPAMVAFSLATGALHVVPAAAWGAAAGLCVFVGLYNIRTHTNSFALICRARTSCWHALLFTSC